MDQLRFLDSTEPTKMLKNFSLDATPSDEPGLWKGTYTFARIGLGATTLTSPTSFVSQAMEVKIPCWSLSLCFLGQAFCQTPVFHPPWAMQTFRFVSRRRGGHFRRLGQWKMRTKWKTDYCFGPDRWSLVFPTGQLSIHLHGKRQRVKDFGVQPRRTPIQWNKSPVQQLVPIRCIAYKCLRTIEKFSRIWSNRHWFTHHAVWCQVGASF